MTPSQKKRLRTVIAWLCERAGLPDRISDALVALVLTGRPDAILRRPVGDPPVGDPRL